MMVPDGGGPRGPGGEPLAMRPHTEYWNETCGHRYHEAAEGQIGNTALCACGTYSIGVCTGCSAPVCGDCSAHREQRRLCRACLAAFDQAAAEAAADAKLRREETARAEAKKHETAAAVAQARHAAAVEARHAEPGVPTGRQLAERQNRLQDRLAKPYGFDLGEAFTGLVGVAFGWFVVVTIAFYVLSEALGISQDRGEVYIGVYGAFAAVGVGWWLARVVARASRTGRRKGWQAELADSRYARGCGSRDCRVCY